jgi:hypothetical protein
VQGEEGYDSKSNGLEGDDGEGEEAYGHSNVVVLMGVVGSDMASKAKAKGDVASVGVVGTEDGEGNVGEDMTRGRFAVALGRLFSALLVVLLLTATDGLPSVFSVAAVSCSRIFFSPAATRPSGVSTPPQRTSIPPSPRARRSRSNCAVASCSCAPLSPERINDAMCA